MSTSNARTKPVKGQQLPKRNAKGVAGFFHKLWAQRDLLLMLLPGILFYAIFKYGPMYGLRIAFIKYSPFLGYDGSPWVGFANFERLFVENADLFWTMLKNTLLHSLLCFGTAFPMSILFALILNEVRMPRVKKTYQTISYLPTFLSGVIVASVFLELFSIKNGIINKLIVEFGGTAVPFTSTVSGYYLIYVLSGLWSATGNSAIIYLSALAGVDQEMYEAAEIDGCSRLKKIWHITLPAIAPTVITMLLLEIGNLIRVGADKSLLLRTETIISDVYMFATYVYDKGIRGGQYSYTAAIGMFQSIVAAVLLFVSNYIAKKRSGTSIW